tara:strand:+ start:649 stop:1140 length:492 start_codon:yes stop_codon:yes gene_type:complete
MQLNNASWAGAAPSEEWKKTLIEFTVAALKGIQPKDEIEGMLAAQMVATHNAILECFRRAMAPEQSLQSRELNLKNGAKLASIYTRQMEALNKHRGKGQQNVTVEHVHVEAGGQAIVGHVEANKKSAHSGTQHHAAVQPPYHTQESPPTVRKRKKVKQPRDGL